MERRHLIFDEALAMARNYPALLGLEPWEIGELEEKKFQISEQIERMLAVAG